MKKESRFNHKEIYFPNTFNNGKIFMIFIKALLTGLVGVSLCMADISGIVTDTGTTPIAGAVVQLEQSGQTATTGADGSFRLIISSAILPVNGKLLPNGLSARISGNTLNLTLAERSAVEVVTFDLNGKALSTVRKTMDAGSHSITLPYRGAGIFLYKVKVRNNEFVIKGNAVDGLSTGNSVTTPGSSSKPLAKPAMSMAAIDDVILITKIGYLNYRIYVGNSDTSGITIKLIARFGTVTDTDGNVYQTVKIGTQEWMVENLRVTKYNDGSPIPLDSSKTFVAAKTPKYCYYNNAGNTDSIIKFGALYNWFVVSPANPLKIAPSGWHVPSDTEWTILTSNTTTSSLAATADWCKPSLKYYCNDMNNSSGFSALPGGCRVYNGSFDDLGQIGYWWSVTGYDTYSAYMRYFLTGTPSGMISNASDKSCGLSVRLLRD